MAQQKKYNVAIVGLGFGAEFIPIYKRHPLANMYAVCQRNEAKMKEIADAFGVEKRYANFDDVLKDPNVDFVHINSPIPDHGWMSIKALKAGKNVACTVPMATSLDECKQIVDLVKQTGLKYMMMETVVYSREYLYMKEKLDKGELGKLQYLQASHQQDMDGWPGYWPGLPPMWYATHCVGPMVGLAGADVEFVSCFGSGTIRAEMIPIYKSPFAVETAHLKFRNSDLSARVIRSLFDVARQYMDHVIEQAITLLKHRKISGLFTTPKLLEAMAEKARAITVGPGIERDTRMGALVSREQFDRVRMYQELGKKEAKLATGGGRNDARRRTNDLF